MKILMLKGLPGSGKTTRALQLVDKGWTRVNKDDLRRMMHAGIYSERNEHQVNASRDHIIIQSLRMGRSVVVDDTNFNPAHYDHLFDIALKEGALFNSEFLDVPVELCIMRDRGRDASVGEEVIRKMHEDYLKKKLNV